jgi:hypothetical protein
VYLTDTCCGISRTYSTHRGSNNAYIIAGKPEWKRKIARPRDGWEDNMKTIHVRGVVRLWMGFSWLRIGSGEGPVGLSMFEVTTTC